MEHKILKTEEEYEVALERLNEVFDAEEGTPEGDEAELLALLVENYEDEHYPIYPPDPIEAIEFRLDQMNLKRKDLNKLFGYRTRVSEIFNKKRKLTLGMIRKLHNELNIPYESLMGEY
jgi:HTH-type transcriptional regulator / antitoxin HigA